MTPPFVAREASPILRDVRENLTNLRRQRTELMRERDEAQAGLRHVDGSLSAADMLNTPEFQRAEEIGRRLESLQSQIGAQEAREQAIVHHLHGTGQVGAVHDSFLSDPAVLQNLRSLAFSDQPLGNMMLGQHRSRDELLAEFAERRRMVDQRFGGQMLAAAGDVVLPSDTSRTGFYGVVQSLKRPLRLLDLIPTTDTDSGVIDYLIEPAGGTTAAETAELAVKPSGSATFTEAQTNVRTVAEWYRLPRQTMADVPALVNAIENRLRWEVESRAELQILNGDGTGQNLRGILNTTGIGAAASAGATVNMDIIRSGISVVRAANAEPTAVVINDTDYSKAQVVKASGSGERLDSDGALGDSPVSPTIWGIPAVVTPAIPAGTALVGNFGGAMVWLREGYSIRMSDSDQSDFISNAVKLLGEMRLGFAVLQPGAFAKCTLSLAA